MSIPTNPYSATDTLSVAPEDKTLGLVAYVLAIFTSWLGPLILWLVKKDQSKFVAYHCIQALMLMGAVFVVAVVVNIVFTILHLPLIAGLIGLVLGIASLALNIMAAIAANKGQWCEMPIVGPYARKAAGV